MEDKASTRDEAAAWPTQSCSADFQSAVSPISNRHGTGQLLRLRAGLCAAEWNSAIQQIGNLRYARSGAAADFLPVFSA